jgi:hypothetical protein
MSIESDWDNYCDLMDEERKNGKSGWDKDFGPKEGEWTEHRDSESARYWVWNKSKPKSRYLDDDYESDGPNPNEED